MAPSIYNNGGIYNLCAAGGDAGGGANVENVKFLANGAVYTDFPKSGCINGVTVDETFPVDGLPVINNSNIDLNGVYFQNDFIKNCFSSQQAFTLDFWFKGISHNYQYTPYFIGLTRLNENDRMLSTNYSDNISNFLFEPFVSGTERFYMAPNNWHHIAAQFKPNGASATTTLFVDGSLKRTKNNVSYSTDNFYLKFNSQANTSYAIGQICIREGVIWESDFTPPTEPYRMY